MVVGNIIIDIKRTRSMQMDLGSTVSSVRRRYVRPMRPYAPPPCNWWIAVPIGADLRDARRGLVG
jgi:hypothetical protein